MAQKGGGQLLRRDAAAIIGDTDIGQSAVLHLSNDGASACVDGVFQQFLDNAGGTLHHLAGGNKIRHMGRQALDLRHGSSLLGVNGSLCVGEKAVRPFLRVCPVGQSDGP